MASHLLSLTWPLTHTHIQLSPFGTLHMIWTGFYVFILRQMLKNYSNVLQPCNTVTLLNTFSVCFTISLEVMWFILWSFIICLFLPHDRPNLIKNQIFKPKGLIAWSPQALISPDILNVTYCYKPYDACIDMYFQVTRKCLEILIN